MFYFFNLSDSGLKDLFSKFGNIICWVNLINNEVEIDLQRNGKPKSTGIENCRWEASQSSELPDFFSVTTVALDLSGERS